MAYYSCNTPQFHPGDQVISTAYHPPEIKPGTPAKIVLPWVGNLCVVQFPDGEIHKWFAWFELEPVDSYPNYWVNLSPGSKAKIISTVGHAHHIKAGTVVRIVRCIYTPFYDLLLHGKDYHRWLAEFEIAGGYLFIERMGVK